MRKYVKKQLLNTCDSLSQAGDILRKLADMGRTEDIAQLLTDMQSAAIQIGETIENSEGEGTEAVHCLEAFCETVWQISQADKSGVKKLTKTINKSVTEIKNQIRNLPEQYVAVFLPYKVSMWDSLASVYEACAKDPACEAYVIPIPYYDKNTDGSIAADHYEADQFPSDVPITHFNDFDYEGVHPDFMFIHNPYDDNNFVTTVHPFFYSKNLRPMTDCLVYIPYFVHQNDYVKDIYAVQPACVWAHVVVLQSEEVRKQYVKYYTEAYKEAGTEATDTDKFKAWGSPKFDTVTRDADKDIPKEWRDKIYDRNGKRRKVIFLNTHMSGLMQGQSERFFKKLESVFETFKANPDVVLLWRPHPLSEATATAMNPEAGARYREIVEQYKKEDFGIYDDTPDLHRSIAISDAYYGSRSSVVELFKNEKKPIMIMMLPKEETEDEGKV